MIAAISLEAPSVPLIEQLIGDNRMPHLATLQRKGENVNLDPPFLRMDRSIPLSTRVIICRNMESTPCLPGLLPSKGSACPMN